MMIAINKVEYAQFDVRIKMNDKKNGNKEDTLKSAMGNTKSA